MKKFSKTPLDRTRFSGKINALLMRMNETRFSVVSVFVATVVVAQLARASDCGSEGRGFEPLQPP